jgi:hypothetical protein
MEDSDEADFLRALARLCRAHGVRLLEDARVWGAVRLDAIEVDRRTGTARATAAGGVPLTVRVPQEDDRG